MKSGPKPKSYKLNKGFITQKIDGKITIFDGEKSQLITFNETASFVFERLKRGIDSKKITDLLVKKYKLNYKKGEGDVANLIRELKSIGIIH